ncbi:MAG: flagellar filament capping protein FliD, partial [Bdellovibrionia bacterium]
LIDIESQPLKALGARKAKEEARLKLFQEFKTKFNGFDKLLNDISSYRKFRELKADLGDGGNLAGIVVDKERAEPGQYSIQIDQLATRGSLITNGFESDEDPVMGAGFVTMDLQNGDSTDIYIDEEHSSLKGIAQAINQAQDGTVRASVIKDASEEEAPWKLILTGRKEGKDNQIDFPEFYFLDSKVEFFANDDKEATNATVLIDGLPVELASNDVSDFVPGINLHLKQARPDQPFTLTVTEDTQKVGGKIKAVVDQINQILQFIVKQNTVDEHTDTATTFAGDTSLQSIEYRIRNTLQSGFVVRSSEGDQPKVIHLSEIGLQFDKTGTLTFNEDKFNKALDKNFSEVSQVISGPDGFVVEMRSLMEGYSRSSSGILTVKEHGLRARIKEIDAQIDRKERTIEQKKVAITERFARLEGTLANLQKQQQYLSSTLPGAGSGSMLSQLLG